LPDPTVLEILDAMAAQVVDELDAVIESLQVVPRMMLSPSPPTIDIYPDTPFTARIGMGAGNREFAFLVRARVGTPDHEGGQDLLLMMMDPRAPTSVHAALESDSTLGGKVEDVWVDGPTGFGTFPSPGGDGSLMGCTWSAIVTP